MSLCDAPLRYFSPTISRFDLLWFPHGSPDLPSRDHKAITSQESKLLLGMVSIHDLLGHPISPSTPPHFPRCPSCLASTQERKLLKIDPREELTWGCASWRSTTSGGAMSNAERLCSCGQRALGVVFHAKSHEARGFPGLRHLRQTSQVLRRCCSATAV